MTIEEIKSYFDGHFYVERLTAKAENKDYKKVRSLVRYYKDDFKFNELQDLMIIKPDYDRKCQAMIQDVSEIERDGIAFWARYKNDN